MCYGVTGPSTDEKPLNRSTKFATHKSGFVRKTPYKGIWGTVLEYYQLPHGYIELFKSKNDNEYHISWSEGLSSGGDRCENKYRAYSKFKNLLPRKEKDKFWNRVKGGLRRN